MVDPVAAVSASIEPAMFLPVGETGALAATAPAATAPAATFGSWFKRELNAVNNQLISAESDVQKLAVGDTQNLHQVMINMEEARLSFQLLVQVRNRLLEAYQEVMRTQV